MAAKKQGTKPVVIVESPAKARTISRFLGKDFVIEASVGHVRDLPANAAEVPAKLKGEKWAKTGVDVENDFTPLYVVPREKRDTIKRLKQVVKDCAVLYLATDEDREGESISWHLVDELKPKAEVKRLVFHEITKDAIQRALENPREINLDLVEAQETRRIVDRLYGYSVSPLLWKKIRPRLSAGRVQSVAVRLVVEREKERIRFVPSDWWGVEGTFRAGEQTPFPAQLASVGGRRIATGKDFDPETGRLVATDEGPLHLTETSAAELVERLRGQPALVEKVEQKPYTERPQPPFTTSTLQQEAGRKLGFTAKRTMRAAQRLYENGYITYMRTDSTTLSNEAIAAARTLIESTYGRENLPAEPRVYRTKVRNAQEAHEAIRPSGSSFTHPSALGADMGSDESRVYDLIWKRTVACQMKDAKGMRTTLTLRIDDALFTTSGRTVEFPGFRLAYVEHSEESETKEGDDSQKLLPKVRAGETIDVLGLEPQGHTTKPPPRLTEASLVRELEARGIGRPSTYASIIDTILQREYCFKKGNALVPSFTAFAVIALLGDHLEWLIDYAFTARMEDDLDEISNGRKRRREYLRGFFIGNGKPGLRDELVAVDERIDPREVCTLRDFDLGDFAGEPIQVRVGRYGPFLSAGGVSASLPEDLAPDELTREVALDLLQKAQAGPKALGVDPETGLSVYVKVGRYGPYLQLGDAESLGDEKPKMASLLPGMDPENVTLEQALQVLALPRRLGRMVLPEGEEGAGEEHEVLAYNGRFGPYLKCHKATRSLTPEDDLLTIDLARAKELFAQPKQRGGRQRQASKVLKELGRHPETDAEIKILEGRYGAYVTDGNVNATVPKEETVDGLALARAIELLDEKAAQGKRARPRRQAKKKATKAAGGKASKPPAKKAAKAAKKPRPAARGEKAAPSGRRESGR